MALSPDQRRRLLRMNMLMAYASFASSKAVAWTPATLFANAEVGGWYDPSDLTTMFQDAAGTTSAALESPVGLVLDKSKGLVLGSELVTNGDFSNGTTGWTAPATNTLTVSSGVAKCTNSNADGAYFGQGISVVSGTWYKFTYTAISDGTSKSVGLNIGNTIGSGTYLTSSTTGYGFGTRSIYWLSTVTGTVYPWFYAGAQAANNYILIDDVTVKSIPGSHLSQSTSTARPVLSATSRIDYDGTDDKITAASSGGGTTGFLFVAGINLDAIGANQTIWSDTGTNTGYRVRINSSNQLELAAGNGTAYTTAATTETLSATTNYVIAAWHDGTNLNVKLGTGGAISSQAFATASAGSAGFTMGMDNGAVSSQLNGKIYNAVYVKNFSGSLADVNNTISYVNGKLA